MYYIMHISDYIDHIFYINLEHRTDRKILIEKEIRKFDKNFDISERFNAIQVKSTDNDTINGALGCSISHLKIIKLCQERNYKNVLILEDDFEFIVDESYFLNLIKSFFENIKKYSFILLGTNLAFFRDTPFQNIFNVSNSRTASGYIINESVFKDYVNILEESILLLEKTKIYQIFAIDVVWQKLQNEYVFSFNKHKRIGKQRESYSDIEKKVVNYNC